MKTTRLPWLTCLFGLIALIAWTTPDASAPLAFDRDAITGGEWWRLFTGHFVHWTGNHLAWDLAAFVGLGAIVEWRSRQAFLLTLAIGAVAISAVVWLAAPQLAAYRGLSSLDTALFATAVSAAGHDALARRAWRAALVPVAALLGCFAKTTLEWTSHANVFVAPSTAFVPVPIAHLAGMLVGVIVVLATEFLTSARGGIRSRLKLSPLHLMTTRGRLRYH